MANQKLPKHIIFWGGTGQAKVMREVVEYHQSEVVAVVDEVISTSPFPQVPLLKSMESFKNWLDQQSYDRSTLGFSVTIGNPHGKVRCQISNQLAGLGLIPVSLIHPYAWIAPDAEIGPGIQIHAGAIISPEAKISEYCIINTKASVDHECVLESGTEVGPGATLCGVVILKKYAWVGAGATILPRLTIGKHAIVGAGAVVTKSVPDNTVVIGVPARLKDQKEAV